MAMMAGVIAVNGHAARLCTKGTQPLARAVRPAFLDEANARAPGDHDTHHHRGLAVGTEEGLQTVGLRARLRQCLGVALLATCTPPAALAPLDIDGKGCVGCSNG
jgi:hypothetical protein